MQMEQHFSNATSVYPSSIAKEKTLDILIAGHNRKQLQQLKDALSNLSGYRITARLMTNGENNPLEGIKIIPDILVFNASDRWSRELQELPRFLNSLKLELIIVSDCENRDCMRMALQIGARDFIYPPLSTKELIASIKRIRGELGSFHRQGQLISTINAKGGCGSTVLACNLAHTLAAVRKLDTVVVDLDLQFGTLCHYLNLQPNHGIRAALEHIDELDELALRAYLLNHSSGLKVLETHPKDIALAEDISDHALNQLLDLLLVCHDSVIIDLPRQIDLLTSTVLERSDHILVTLQQDISALRYATRLLEILRKNIGIDNDNIEIIVNRYNKNASIDLKDICSTLSVDRCHTIPNDFTNIHQSVETGIPLYELNRKSGASKAIIELEHQLFGQPTHQKGIFNKLSRYLKGA